MSPRSSSNLSSHLPDDFCRSSNLRAASAALSLLISSERSMSPVWVRGTRAGKTTLPPTIPLILPPGPTGITPIIRLSRSETNDSDLPPNLHHLEMHQGILHGLKEMITSVHSGLPHSAGLPDGGFPGASAGLSVPRHPFRRLARHFPGLRRGCDLLAPKPDPACIAGCSAR
jgi:hypothetical protein